MDLSLIFEIYCRNAAAVKIATEKRDFNHLRNNQLQISQGIAAGFKDIEGSLDQLHQQIVEIKAWLIPIKALFTVTSHWGFRLRS